MDVYAVPFQGAFLVYRPLRRLAFVANAAMVNRVAAALARESRPDRDDVGAAAEQDEPEQFLESIGFFEPDPEPPAPAGDADPGQARFTPTTAVCLLTTACNMRCVYCYAAAGEGGATAELPFELGRRAIDIVHDNAVEAGERTFALGLHGGGEPTLARGSFRPLVEHARRKDLRCEISLASNGYWGAAQRDWILDHVDQVSLSFDGSEALQNRQRPLRAGQGSFERVMQTIRAMDRRAFAYGLRLTVTDWGIEQLPDAVAFICRETACSTIQVEPAFAHGRARSQATALADNQRFAAAFLAAYDIARAGGRHVYYSGARPWALTERFCRALDSALIVAPDGALTACYEVHGRQHELAPDFFVGTLAEHGAPALDAEAQRRLRHTVAERRRLCEGCFCYWHCAGDCPPKSMTADHSGHLRFGPRCDLNRLLTKELLARYIAESGGVWRGETDAADVLCEVRP